MKLFKRLLSASALLVALSMPALADGIDAPRVSNMTPKEFLAFHAKVDKKLESKSYEHVDNEQRRNIEEAQDQIESVLTGKSSMDQLSDDERLKLFNAHEHVVAIMNDAELDRRICKREKKIGSHRGELVCHTQRQLDEERQLNRNRMQRTRICQGLGCGG